MLLLPRFMVYGFNVVQGQDFVQYVKKSSIEKNPDDYEIWEKALMAAGDKKCDWTDKKYIKPIIDCLGV